MSDYLFQWNDNPVEVDLSSQVLELEVDDEVTFWSVRGRPDLKRERKQDIAAIDVKAPVEPYLYPQLPCSPTLGNWTPSLAFSLKAKAFDDGCLAAVELLVQEGTPRLAGRRGLVEGVRKVLRGRWSASASDDLGRALAFLQVALSMSGEVEESDAGVTRLAKKLRKDFNDDPTHSKPQGFYSWSPALRSVFLQDRFLQTGLPANIAELLHQALAEEPSRLADYQRHLSLMARLTNPLVKPAVHEEGSERCFLPPSDSHEGRIVKSLFATKEPPEGFQLVHELIQRIRDGRLDTTPGPHSGVYDYQLHALVPLLFPERTPEAERLVLGPKYCAELEAQFRALFALARETQAKQLEQLYGGGCPLIVAPKLSLEPLAEHYRRRAETYRLLRQLLGEFLGAPALALARRLKPKGTHEESLWDELVWMEQLFRGAHAIARNELGFGPIPEADLSAAMLTRRWMRTHHEDPDVVEDPRCVVPLFFDVERQQTKVLAVMGFLSTPVKAHFRRKPQVTVLGPPPSPPWTTTPRFETRTFNTLCLVTEEVYVNKVPDRDEFRALCDKHYTRDAIVKALCRRTRRRAG
ncbi:hypothetical protein MYSTI_06753 [Myxococcus stipitatus DSM 14675]|uniref:Uncharacterized protein n=1 Tax=Myxococcus stipitatus (strain DSM 14675 / JCM 12634 / Mx s8) TaxID=1278073 RepID=L7UGD1_MYXSD|nr:hypothetical protein [Myxococcus stipitatus]AGC48026.1 hypothetical protein MYSTI_06753 [Myxococcus stipitatus DSM 14675]